MGIRSDRPENRICPGIELDEYSRGMGGMGLPGDLSSASRFVRAAFTKSNSTCADSDEGGMTQFFHILDSVQQVKGCCDLGDGKYEITVYSSCCNTDLGIYYCRTYDNSRIVGVDMNSMNLDAVEPYVFTLPRKQDVMMLNRPTSSSPGHTP
jgi:choloylglycine hydrolase